MKIRKLKIKNYKIFDDVEFDFTDQDGKTLDTVVLAGVNGCGKTTLDEPKSTGVHRFKMRGSDTVFKITSKPMPFISPMDMPILSFSILKVVRYLVVFGQF